jgi:hypothetical protein
MTNYTNYSLRNTIPIRINHVKQIEAFKLEKYQIALKKLKK